MHDLPKAHSTGCTKVQKRKAILKNKWVPPFPRARMRLAPQIRSYDAAEKHGNSRRLRRRRFRELLDSLQGGA